MSWWTADGGGQTFPGLVTRTGSTGGNYPLGGTNGQPDAGLLTGTSHSLSGGFWFGGAAGGVYRVYLPVVMRNY